MAGTLVVVARERLCYGLGRHDTGTNGQPGSDSTHDATAHAASGLLRVALLRISLLRISLLRVALLRVSSLARLHGPATHAKALRAIQTTRVGIGWLLRHWHLSLATEDEVAGDNDPARQQ